MSSLLNTIEDRVDAIAQEAHDPEAAHGDEDDLYEEVLTWIRDHSSDDAARRLAREALRTKELDFSRWCA